MVKAKKAKKEKKLSFSVMAETSSWEVDKFVIYDEDKIVKDEDGREILATVPLPQWVKKIYTSLHEYAEEGEKLSDSKEFVSNNNKRMFHLAKFCKNRRDFMWAKLEYSLPDELFDFYMENDCDQLSIYEGDELRFLAGDEEEDKHGEAKKLLGQLLGF